jgi:hypothetical protein
MRMTVLQMTYLKNCVFEVLIITLVLKTHYATVFTIYHPQCALQTLSLRDC